MITPIDPEYRFGLISPSIFDITNNYYICKMAADMAKRGRHPIDAAERKSAPISVAVTPALRHQLADAAQQSGRKLSQEAEERLRLSFDDRQKIEEFGGATNYLLLREIAAGIRMIEERSGQQWWTDRYTFDECRDVLIGVWDRFKPKGRRIVPESPLAGPTLGARVASAIVATLELALERPGEFGRAADAAALAVGTKVKKSALDESRHQPLPTLTQEGFERWRQRRKQGRKGGQST